MVGRHHRLNRHEFLQTPADSDGQGSLPLQSMGSQRVGHERATEEQQFRSVQQQQQQQQQSLKLWQGNYAWDFLIVTLNLTSSLLSQVLFCFYSW